MLIRIFSVSISCNGSVGPPSPQTSLRVGGSPRSLGSLEGAFEACREEVEEAEPTSSAGTAGPGAEIWKCFAKPPTVRLRR